MTEHIVRAFEEELVSLGEKIAHMGGLAWKLGRRMEWDPVREEIIALPGEDLDAVLLQTNVGEYVLET